MPYQRKTQCSKAKAIAQSGFTYNVYITQALPECNITSFHLCMNYERLPQFSEAKYNFYAANGNFQSQVDALYIILNSG